ncbi:MAG: response regulator [Candidatus Dormibacteria bacterium]
MSEARVIRVMVVDDRPIFRMGVRGMLAEHPDIECVGEAVDGREAVSRARDLRPDVILMDVDMPVMDGVEATRAITGELTDTNVVALTVSDDDSDVIRMVAAGASGYMLKETGPAELAHAVREAARGRVALDAGVGRRVLQRLGQEAARRIRDTIPVTQPLTPREKQILRLVAQGAANKEIARAVGASEATVKVHLRALYRKLGVSSRSAAAARAQQLDLEL